MQPKIADTKAAVDCLWKCYQVSDHLHQTPDFCGHWVRQLYRKNQVRKNQGYCYVVIRALDCQHCANFKKTANFEGSYIL